jgi:RNA polymerase sigma factor (sigma-70 family)
MTTDSELLHDYATNGSESAFAELVERHLDFVYSAALRQLDGDGMLAKDVAQSVFVDLARKAHSLTNRASLAGWLYTSARFAAISTIRSEQRRRLREEEAAQMHQDSSTADDEIRWNEMRRVLDEAMHELEESDREALLLRFFQGRDLRTVGVSFGISEDAARKRVERALEKLRDKLRPCGINSTAALTTALGCANLDKAPKGLSTKITNSITGTAVAPTTATGSSAMTKLTIGIASSLVLLGIATTVLIQLRGGQRLKPERGRLQAQARPVESLPPNRGAGNRPVLPDASKVALLDQKRAFDGSPKTKTYDSEIRTLGRSMEQEDERLRKDESVSSEERDRRVREFRVKAQRELEQKKLHMRDEILSDISKTTAEVARKRGYTLVLDRASLVEGVRKVLFAADDVEKGSSEVDESLQTEYLKLVDLTEDVLGALPPARP